MTQGVVESVYWSHTYEELGAAISTKLGFESAKLATFAQSMALVAERIFSGGGGAPSPAPDKAPEGVMVPKNSSELAAALAAVLRN